jgi:hypothetical protein
MPKFSAVITVVVAFLIVPALASADPTASQISTPAGPAFVAYDSEHASSLHVAGTTSGGSGDVDIRCYFGSGSALLATAVPVTGGSFATDIAITESLMSPTLAYPYPYCTLRAVPTGTIPAAAPDAVTPWAGPSIGWGYHKVNRLGAAFAPNPADTIFDYWMAQTQASAENDFDSVGSCGLCDTYLFQPGTKARANPIWWANGGLYASPIGVTGRTAVNIDGVSAFTGSSAYSVGGTHQLANNPGFPGISVNSTVDPANGNLTIDEHSPFVKCAGDATVWPPTDASCPTLTPTGVELDREWRTSDDGLQVTMVDHWRSVDGKSHELDAIYDDTEHSANANIAGREARADFTWTGDGMKAYVPGTPIAAPPTVPATMLVKTDASTPDSGDNTNPFGAMVFGTRPTGILVHNLGDATKNADWQSHYQLTIPAYGELSLANGYAADLTLDSVESKAAALAPTLTAPAIAIESPADGATVDTATAHVTGTASSADGNTSVEVNGVAASITGGQWTADVPLAEGDNRVVAVASNGIGVASTAVRSLTRATAPAPAQTGEPAPATTTPVAAVTPKAVHCVVPKLRGKTLAASKRLLKRAHCRLGKVSRKANAQVKPSRVISTRLKAGSRHAAGTRVRLTLAKAR